MTVKDIKELRTEAQKILKNADEKESLNYTVEKLYCDKLFESSRKAYIKAEKIINAVNKFDEQINKAISDKNGFIESYLNNVTNKNYPINERCTYLFRFIAVESILLSDHDDDKRKQLMEEALSYSVSEKDATPEYEEELKQKLKEILISDEALAVHLSKMGNKLKSINVINDNDITDTEVIDFKHDDKALRVVITALLHIKIKTGKITEISNDTPLDQIAFFVCGAEKQIQVFEEMQKDKIDIIIATVILSSAILVCTLPFVASILAEGVAGIAALAFGTIFFNPLVLLLSMADLILGTLYMFGVIAGTAKAVSFVNDKINAISKQTDNKKRSNIINDALNMIKSKMSSKKEEKEITNEQIVYV